MWPNMDKRLEEKELESNNFSFQWQNSMTAVSVAMSPCCCSSEGHQHNVSIPSSINLGKTLPNNAAMKNRTDLNLGDVFCLSIIYHIPDS